MKYVNLEVANLDCAPGGNRSGLLGRRQIVLCREFDWGSPHIVGFDGPLADVPLPLFVLSCDGMLCSSWSFSLILIYIRF